MTQRKKPENKRNPSKKSKARQPTATQRIAKDRARKVLSDKLFGESSVKGEGTRRILADAAAVLHASLLELSVRGADGTMDAQDKRGLPATGSALLRTLSMLGVELTDDIGDGDEL